MTSQEKDKFICEKLGAKWFDDRTLQHRNSDFTSEAGRIQLLKLMEKRKDYFDFINYIGKAVPLFSTVACFISADFMLDDNGAFQSVVYKWLGGK